jgi:hypothetical protein
MPELQMNTLTAAQKQTTSVIKARFTFVNNYKHFENITPIPNSTTPTRSYQRLPPNPMTTGIAEVEKCVVALCAYHYCHLLAETNLYQSLLHLSYFPELITEPLRNQFDFTFHLWINCAQLSALNGGMLYAIS